MRLLTGTPSEFANETPTTLHMSKFLASVPEMLPQVTTLFDRNISAFSSLLARRNMFSGKLADPLNPKSGRYKIVGNRKVMWKIQGYPERKATIVGEATCTASPDAFGKFQSWIEIPLNINWFSPRDVVELADNRTQLFVADSMLPQEVEAGKFIYRMKVNTNDPKAFVQAGLLREGMEISILHNQFEEMSTTGYEKYTFNNEMAYTHMTIQRLKWSISGSADEYKPSARWIEHNGYKMWVDQADLELMQRAALYRERQMLTGHSTVGADDKVLVKTSEGFDVMAGDGILNQGDGAWRLPYNVLSRRVIESIMENMSIYSSGWGQEIAVICGRQWYNNFAALMKNEAGIDPKTVVVDGNTGKGINLDYNSYTFGGVTIIPTVVPWFDSPYRATTYGSDGVRNSSHNAIFVSMGNVTMDQPAIELLALGKRTWIEGEINGINKGGDMANSIDARQKHAIWETGVAMLDINGIAELFNPVKI